MLIINDDQAHAEPPAISSNSELTKGTQTKSDNNKATIFSLSLENKEPKRKHIMEKATLSCIMTQLQHFLSVAHCLDIFNHTFGGSGSLTVVGQIYSPSVGY